MVLLFWDGMEVEKDFDVLKESSRVKELKCWLEDFVVQNCYYNCCFDNVSLQMS